MKEKYKEIFLGGLVGFIFTLMLLWITGVLNARANTKDTIDSKLDRTEFIDEKKRVNDKLDLKVDEDAFNKLDNKVETMRIEWREDQGKIIEKLDKILLKQ